MADVESQLASQFSEVRVEATVQASAPPDVKPIIVDLPPVSENRKKIEERPVVRRNTGTISVQNLRRRRLLSVSADRASDYFRALGAEQNRNGVTPMRIRDRRPTVTIIVPSIPLAARAPPANSSIQQVAQQMQPPPPPPQQQQQPRQQQQQQQQNQQNPVVELARLLRNDSYCPYCSQQYANVKGLRKHQKTQKHTDSINNVAPERQQLLDRAYRYMRSNFD